jgi:hypothetical protein
MLIIHGIHDTVHVINMVSVHASINTGTAQCFFCFGGFASAQKCFTQVAINELHGRKINFRSPGKFKLMSSQREGDTWTALTAEKSMMQVLCISVPHTRPPSYPVTDTLLIKRLKSGNLFRIPLRVMAVFKLKR